MQGSGGAAAAALRDAQYEADAIVRHCVAHARSALLDATHAQQCLEYERASRFALASLAENVLAADRIADDGTVGTVAATATGTGAAAAEWCRDHMPPMLHAPSAETRLCVETMRAAHTRESGLRRNRREDQCALAYRSMLHRRHGAAQDAAQTIKDTAGAYFCDVWQRYITKHRADDAVYHDGTVSRPCAVCMDDGADCRVARATTECRCDGTTVHLRCALRICFESRLANHPAKCCLCRAAFTEADLRFVRSVPTATASVAVADSTAGAQHR